MRLCFEIINQQTINSKDLFYSPERRNKAVDTNFVCRSDRDECSFFSFRQDEFPHGLSIRARQFR